MPRLSLQKKKKKKQQCVVKGECCDDFWCEIDEEHLKGSSTGCCYHPKIQSPQQRKQPPPAEKGPLRQRNAADPTAKDMARRRCLCGATLAQSTKGDLCAMCRQLVAPQDARAAAAPLNSRQQRGATATAGSAVKRWLDPLGLGERRRTKKQQPASLAMPSSDAVVGDGVAAYDHLVMTRNAAQQHNTEARKSLSNIQEEQEGNQEGGGDAPPGGQPCFSTQMWEMSWQRGAISDEWEDMEPSQTFSQIAAIEKKDICPSPKMGNLT